MATRGIIAREKMDTTFEGRYHHWDSYFEDGLGETLCSLYQGYFQRDLKAMLRVLIDEHPAGWSSIVDRDFTLSPGWRSGPDDDRSRPECYCHGGRHEAESLYTSLPNPNQTDIEYVYVIDEYAMMTVYRCTSSIHGYKWEIVKTVNMAAQSL